MRPGVALRPGTPIEGVYPLDEAEVPVEMVLVMTVEPGFGGQKFMHEMMDKVWLSSSVPICRHQLKQVRRSFLPFQLTGGIGLVGFHTILSFIENLTLFTLEFGSVRVFESSLEFILGVFEGVLEGFPFLEGLGVEREAPIRVLEGFNGEEMELGFRVGGRPASLVAFFNCFWRLDIWVSSNLLGFRLRV